MAGRSPGSGAQHWLTSSDSGLAEHIALCTGVSAIQVLTMTERLLELICYEWPRWHAVRQRMDSASVSCTCATGCSSVAPRLPFSQVRKSPPEPED